MPAGSPDHSLSLFTSRAAIRRRGTKPRPTSDLSQTSQKISSDHHIFLTRSIRPPAGFPIKCTGCDNAGYYTLNYPKRGGLDSGKDLSKAFVITSTTAMRVLTEAWTVHQAVWFHATIFLDHRSDRTDRQQG